MLLKFKRRKLKHYLNIPSSSFLFIMLISSAGAALQGVSLFFFLRRQILLAIPLHFALPLTVFIIARQKKDPPMLYNLWIFLGLSSLFLGIMGTGGWFIAYVLCSGIFKPRNTLREYRDYINLKYTREEIIKELTLESYHRTTGKIYEKGELAAYIDILQGTDVKLKLSVIEKLSSTCDPVRIKMLKTALIDPNSEVRFSAANSLRKVEDRLNNKILELTQKKRLNPVNDWNYAELGLAYGKYAFIGILDQDTTQFYRNQAIEAFEKAVSINPFEEEYYKNLGRILLQAGRIDESVNALKQGLEINPESLPISSWLMEYYYKKREFEKLQNIARKFSGKHIENERLRQVIEWWGNI